jgi:hypothetical protein
MTRSGTLGWQEDLPLDAQQRREVFARFGVAMYYAQCLEHQLGLMLASMYNRQFLEVPPENRDALYDTELAKTLGRMVKDLKNAIDISPTLQDRLNNAVEIRNWLAHRYFYERSREILSLRGREQMISELQEQADFLQALDTEFTKIMKQWMEHLGVSQEDIYEEMRTFLREKHSKRT